MVDLQVLPLLEASYRARLDAGSDIAGHLPYLRTTAAAVTREDAVVAEFGVRAGNSTCALLAGLLDAGKGHLYSVDLNETPDLFWFGGTGRWSFLEADALGRKAAEWVPPEIDVLFVDLDPHSFDQTAAMILAWLPRVRKGGTALFHDTSWGGGTGVRDALEASGVAWENREGSNGLGVVRL